MCVCSLKRTMSYFMPIHESLSLAFIGAECMFCIPLVACASMSIPVINQYMQKDLKTNWVVIGAAVKSHKTSVKSPTIKTFA